MSTTRRTLAALVVAAIAVTACGSDTPSDESPDPTMTDGTMTDDTMVDGTMTDDTMVDGTMTDDTMTDDTMVDGTMPDETMTDDTMTDGTMVDEGAAALAEWQTLPITDVAGETFSIGELSGAPVLVETFATWCSNCRAQLGETQEAAVSLGDQAAVLALSVETDIDPADVADYAASNGFDDIRFAVASPELVAALVEAFGNSVVVPPSTPKFTVDADGRPSELVTGAESADELLARLGVG
jgi:thiol-disulfide isomerase/thioredoxin